MGIMMEAKSNERHHSDHHVIGSDAFAEPPEFGGLSGCCCASSQSNISGSGFSMHETGFGSLQLFASGYPILNFY